MFLYKDVLHYYVFNLLATLNIERNFSLRKLHTNNKMNPLLCGHYKFIVIREEYSGHGVQILIRDLCWHTWS